MSDKESFADRIDVDGNPVALHQLVLMEPDWACDKIRALEAENDRNYKAYKAEIEDRLAAQKLQLAAEKERDELKQAIQHTLDTGMDRYIREALEK